MWNPRRERIRRSKIQDTRYKLRRATAYPGFAGIECPPYLDSEVAGVFEILTSEDAVRLNSVSGYLIFFV